ncbi:MAG TPA: response regulator [Puia sp.]|nr:response regulator [Puia sp.]
MSKRFLVIDDDSDDRELFSEALASVDPEIVCDQATDGAEALKRLIAQEIAKPDIVFLDINMPVMNGWQFLTRLKNEDQYKHIPVIVYTTSSNVRDRLIATDLGALCFITKPHAFARLKNLLGIVVSHVHARNFALICDDVHAMGDMGPRPNRAC